MSEPEKVEGHPRTKAPSRAETASCSGWWWSSWGVPRIESFCQHECLHTVCLVWLWEKYTCFREALCNLEDGTRDGQPYREFNKQSWGAGACQNRTAAIMWGLVWAGELLEQIFSQGAHVVELLALGAYSVYFIRHLFEK